MGSIMSMRSVLITGASTGIGKATALHLDTAGWRVFACVRREEDAGALSEVASERLVPLFIDVTDSDQIGSARETIEACDGFDRLDGLVNNAGIMVVGPLETIPVETFRQQIEVNLLGHVAVTQAMLPLIRRARGRIVFVGSLAGRMAYPFGSGYHASKFGLEAIADSLRQELRPWRIEVSMIEPGAIDTPIWDRTRQVSADLSTTQQVQLYGETLERFWTMGKRLEAHRSDPEKVAKAIARALCDRRARHRYTVGMDARMQLAAHRLIPRRAFEWLVAKGVESRD
jgi:NAD(P)-dependent dehydrogenase (short-subunit alcohol dehydrogenase family)